MGLWYDYFVIRILPFILIPFFILGGLWYWRNLSSQQTQNVPQASEIKSDAGPVEVPKSLPGATTDEKVASLESAVDKLVLQINSLKTSGSSTTVSSQDAKISDLESAVTDLKARISALEKATPASAVSLGKSTVYIPLGAGGYWTDIDWHTLTEYEVSLNPDNYPGYSGMNLEVNFRLAEPSGTGSVRLYNVTDNTAVSSQVDTNSTVFALFSTASFKLSAGTKTYRLQVKSTERKELHIQSARIKVNF